MIVTCERCEQRYRIRAEKLPPQGGKIRCPTCRHVFIVKPSADGHDDDEKTPVPEQAASLRGDATKPVLAPSPKAAEKAPDKVMEKPAPVAEKPAPAEKAVEKPKPAAEKAKADAPPDGPSTWKLRVSGLTYAFQTLDSVQAWLQNRDNVEGIKIARDADDWKELGDYPDVLTPQLATKFFPLGDIPTSENTEARKNAEPAAGEPSAPAPAPSKAPERGKTKSQLKPATKAKDKAPQKGRPGAGKAAASSSGARTWGLILVVCIGLAFALHFAGAIRLPFLGGGGESEYKGTFKTGSGGAETKGPRTDTPDAGSKIVIVETEVVDETSSDVVEYDTVAEDKAFADALAAGQKLVAEKQWPKARVILEKLRSERPETLEVHEALVSVYKGLKLTAEGEATKQAIKELKNKPAPEPTPPPPAADVAAAPAPDAAP